MREDEMVGWRHQLNGHGFGYTPGVGDGQGGLVCCGSWGHKESDTTERLNRMCTDRENSEAQEAFSLICLFFVPYFSSQRRPAMFRGNK